MVARESWDGVPPPDSAVPAELALIADAIDAPVIVICERGQVLLANAAARRCYPRRPAWLDARGPLPSCVKVVPLALDDRRLSIVLATPIASEPADATHTPWAQAWALPPRYARVAALLIDGRTDKEIAAVLELAVSTVRTYVRGIYARAGVRSRTELARAALCVDVDGR